MKTKRQNTAFKANLKVMAGLLFLMLAALCSNSQNQKDRLTSFDTPQTYSGKIEIDSSKNVELSLTLSADAGQITEIKLTAEKLYLTPDNYTAKNVDSKAQFVFMEQTSARTVVKTRNEGGYNVVATNENGQSIVSHIEFTGGIASNNAVDMNSDKLQLDGMPLICDLTVTNSRIYGTVKIELNGGGTKTVNAELKNSAIN